MCAQTSAAVIGFRRAYPLQARARTGHPSVSSGSVCRYRRASAAPSLVAVTRTVATTVHPHRPKRTLETILMKRQIRHPAAHPYRLTRAAIQAHREHLPTPFLGCPVCALRAPVEPLKIRWMSPRRA